MKSIIIQALKDCKPPKSTGEFGSYDYALYRGAFIEWQFAVECFAKQLYKNDSKKQLKFMLACGHPGRVEDKLL